MLSSGFPSASTPNLSSVPAARSGNAAIAYPKLTCQADPDSINQPNRRGEVLPPNGRAERIEAGIGERSRFKGEDFARGKLGGTGGSQCNKEYYAPGDRLSDCRKQSRAEHVGCDKQKHATRCKGSGVPGACNEVKIGKPPTTHGEQYQRYN
jgi:hypothetical protein